jgi:hypothetical protein
VDYPSDARAKSQTKPGHAEPTMQMVMLNVGSQWKRDRQVESGRYYTSCMFVANKVPMKVTNHKIYIIHAP